MSITNTTNLITFNNSSSTGINNTNHGIKESFLEKINKCKICSQKINGIFTTHLSSSINNFRNYLGNSNNKVMATNHQSRILNQCKIFHDGYNKSKNINSCENNKSNTYQYSLDIKYEKRILKCFNRLKEIRPDYIKSYINSIHTLLKLISKDEKSPFVKLAKEIYSTKTFSKESFDELKKIEYNNLNNRRDKIIYNLLYLRYCFKNKDKIDEVDLMTACKKVLSIVSKFRCDGQLKDKINGNHIACNADYISALKKVDPNILNLCVFKGENGSYCYSNKKFGHDERVSIQSTSKPINLAYYISKTSKLPDNMITSHSLHDFGDKKNINSNGRVVNGCVNHGALTTVSNISKINIDKEKSSLNITAKIKFSDNEIYTLNNDDKNIGIINYYQRHSELDALIIDKKVYISEMEDTIFDQVTGGNCNQKRYEELIENKVIDQGEEEIDLNWEGDLITDKNNNEYYLLNQIKTGAINKLMENNNLNRNDAIKLLKEKCPKIYKSVVDYTMLCAVSMNVKTLSKTYYNMNQELLKNNINGKQNSDLLKNQIKFGGLYNESDEYNYSSKKSGVGGMIVGYTKDDDVICALSPPLDHYGNSLHATYLENITRILIDGSERQNKYHDCKTRVMKLAKVFGFSFFEYLKTKNNVNNIIPNKLIIDNSNSDQNNLKEIENTIGNIVHEVKDFFDDINKIRTEDILNKKNEIIDKYKVLNIKLYNIKKYILDKIISDTHNSNNLLNNINDLISEFESSGKKILEISMKKLVKRLTNIKEKECTKKIMDLAERVQNHKKNQNDLAYYYRYKEILSICINKIMSTYSKEISSLSKSKIMSIDKNSLEFNFLDRFSNFTEECISAVESMNVEIEKLKKSRIV